jgi:ribonuclease PH
MAQIRFEANSVQDGIRKLDAVMTYFKNFEILNIVLLEEKAKVERSL